MTKEVAFDKIVSNFIIARGTIQFTDYKKTLSNAVEWLKPGRVAFIGCGFGLNITDEYRAKVNEFLKIVQDGKVNTEPDRFDELIIEGYRHLMDNYFDDRLEYVKALNLNGFVFEIKKSARSLL